MSKRSVLSKYFHGFALVLVAHVLCFTVSARADSSITDTCPTQQAPKIDVHWNSSPVKYDFTKNSQYLKSLGSDTINPYGPESHTQVGGKMKGDMLFKTGVEATGLHNKLQNKTCLWIDKVTVEITADETIFIASEFPEGTCQFNVNLEHEHKHVTIEHTAINEHLDLIRKAAEDAAFKVGVVGPKPTEDADMYAQKMREYVEGEVKKEIRALEDDSKMRQQGLDSREEYDRGSAACRK